MSLSMNGWRNRLIPALAVLLLAGCGSGGREEQDFTTSGSREADQRAEQRMSREEQLRGEGSGGEKTAGEGKPTLYERLGGEEGVTAIVDDFVTRALADPRVNWDRRGVTRGGFSLRRNQSVQWDANEANVAQLKKHLVQFISLASGGPPHYDGREMKQVHENLQISNAEFDATVGDLKATLDKLQLPNQEQKELLGIIETTRPQVVTNR